MLHYKTWFLIMLLNLPLLVGAVDKVSPQTENNPPTTQPSPQQQLETKQALTQELVRLEKLQEQIKQEVEKLEREQELIVDPKSMLLNQALATPNTASQKLSIQQAFATPNTISQKLSVWVEPVTKLEFVQIPKGCFLMGSPASEPKRMHDEQQHQVCLETFWISKTEMTQAQWLKVMGYNPSKLQEANNPVEQVSWFDVQNFIDKLSGGIRLPTEAEWEYAARAGTTTAFHTGHCISTAQANYDGTHAYPECTTGENRKKIVPVGSFAPNAYGLYDMHGNVWEWTCSAYVENYNGEEQVCFNSKALTPKRILRGGSWYDLPHRLRSASRHFRTPDYRANDIGFRLVKEK